MAVPQHAAENERFGTDPPDPSRRDPLDTMPTGSFESSNVHSAIYDWGERQLFVRYLRDGPDAIYQYWDVGPDTWDGLKMAGSKGSYVNSQIAHSFTYALFAATSFPSGRRWIATSGGGSSTTRDCVVTVSD